MGHRSPIAGLLVVAAVTGAVAGGIAGYLAGTSSRPTTPLSGASLPPPQSAARIQVMTSNDAIVKAVQRMTPAVVKIETMRAPNMFDLFDQWMRGGPLGPIVGVGSGFIVDYGGRPLVLTNTHVVGDAEQLRVKLTDGRVFPGRLVGADLALDVAVVEMVNAPNNLVPASLGDSDRLQVGEWVIAMGNPFGYENTVTVGVVSAVGYRPVGEGKKRKVIQTDAAINPGNSGGPLVDLGGNVVGINYKIFSTTNATVGIGFAIPINEARSAIKPLVEGGPWIGLGEMMPNSQGLASYLGLATDRGVVVLSIWADSPAAHAGIRELDVILEVDGKPVSGVSELRDAILAHSIGDTIRLTVQRGQQVLHFSVVAGRIPGAFYPGGA
ncbi:MAG: trypsin-like peptidase domain-containing protein [Armatimonadetes bacterium]|nr:trypsin-like peptidase domain-containing protein [Armatimonadota bacterium]